MSWRISYRIEQICKSLGIDYHSKHLKKSNFHEDAIHLNNLYQQLKQIAAEIVEVADKHGLENLAKILWRDIKIIEDVDHDLARIATLINKKGNNDNTNCTDRRR